MAHLGRSVSIWPGNNRQCRDMGFARTNSLTILQRLWMGTLMWLEHILADLCQFDLANTSNNRKWSNISLAELTAYQFSRDSRWALCLLAWAKLLPWLWYCNPDAFLQRGRSTYIIIKSTFTTCLTRWHRITLPAGLWLMAQVGLLMLGAVSAEVRKASAWTMGSKFRWKFSRSNAEIYSILSSWNKHQK